MLSDKEKNNRFSMQNKEKHSLFSPMYRKLKGKNKSSMNSRNSSSKKYLQIEINTIIYNKNAITKDQTSTFDSKEQIELHNKHYISTN